MALDKGGTEAEVSIPDKLSSLHLSDVALYTHWIVTELEDRTLADGLYKVISF